MYNFFHGQCVSQYIMENVSLRRWSSQEYREPQGLGSCSVSSWSRLRRSCAHPWSMNQLQKIYHAWHYVIASWLDAEITSQLQFQLNSWPTFSWNRCCCCLFLHISPLSITLMALLKLFYGFRHIWQLHTCYNAPTIHCVQWSLWTSRGRGDLGVKTLPVPYCHPANTDKKQCCLSPDYLGSCTGLCQLSQYQK